MTATPVLCEVCQVPVGQHGGEPIRRLARNRYAHPSCLQQKEEQLKPKIVLPDRRLWRPR